MKRCPFDEKVHYSPLYTCYISNQWQRLKDTVGKEKDLREKPSTSDDTTVMTVDWGFVHRAWEKWALNSVGSSDEPLKAAMLLNYDPTGPSRLLSVIAEQQGIKAKPAELQPFLDFVKQKNALTTQYFFIGFNQYLLTSIHEHWFCARCVNTLKPAGEGVIVMQTVAFLLVAMYEGSIGSASQAMAAVDQFASILSKRNL